MSVESYTTHDRELKKHVSVVTAICKELKSLNIHRGSLRNRCLCSTRLIQQYEKVGIHIFYALESFMFY